MIKSMTGFGKSEATVRNRKITVEIRSLNSKQLDINVKVPPVYRQSEYEIRNIVARRMQRGKVDLFVTVESLSTQTSARIDREAFREYIRQMNDALVYAGIDAGYDAMLAAVMRLPDVVAAESESVSDEERQEFVDIINTNTKLLLKLVGDVLELSRIESGNLSFIFQRESVRQLLDDVYQTHSLLIQPPLQFLKDFPPEDVQVNVDPMRLTQVLTNFLNNANKFTKEGSIQLGYCCPSGMSEVHLYVEDTGIGIPHSEQKMIFERFYKRSEFSQGVGLGLSICVLIVEKMGGRIELRSEEGRGSRFTVVLPCIE